MAKQPLKIIFAGTPEFAAVTLRSLLENNHDICMVYTQLDRPAGRGQQLQASAVKQVAQANHIPVRQPVSLRDVKEQQLLNDLHADLMIVVAYGLILPKPILVAPRLGCINVHASLLPRWRGAAPIQQAILAGDEETGVTIMQMDEGLDTGPMLHKMSCQISETDTSKDLHDRLALLGAESLLMVLADLHSGIINAEPQDDKLACYANKITKQQAKIDWQASAVHINRMVRAFNPTPVAFTQYREQTLRIWKTEVVTEAAVSEAPGTVMLINKTGVEVVTGQGVVRLLQVQLPGGKVLTIADILNSKPEFFTVGAVMQ